jgi:hypothetical protein
MIVNRCQGGNLDFIRSQDKSIDNAKQKIRPLTQVADSLGDAGVNREARLQRLIVRNNRHYAIGALGKQISTAQKQATLTNEQTT